MKYESNSAKSVLTIIDSSSSITDEDMIHFEQTYQILTLIQCRVGWKLFLI